MKHFFFIAILISLLSNSAHAQSDSEPELKSSGEVGAVLDEREAEQVEKPKQPEVKKSNTKPPKKVFKPTEEISEDRPVPFPIDI